MKKVLVLAAALPLMCLGAAAGPAVGAGAAADEPQTIDRLPGSRCNLGANNLEGVGHARHSAQSRNEIGVAE